LGVARGVVGSTLITPGFALRVAGRFSPGPPGQTYRSGPLVVHRRTRDLWPGRQPDPLA